MDLLAKLKNIVRRVKITGPADNTGQFPVQQMTFKGKLINVMQIFPYGTYSNLSNESLGVMFSIDGNSSDRVALCYDPKNRPKDLEQNEVAFYHPPTQSFIKFRNNGDLEVSTVEGETKGSIIINCTNATVNAETDITVTAGNNIDITATADVNVSCVNSTVTASTSAEIDTPITTMTGNVQIDGNLTVTGTTTLGSTVTSGGKDISNTHNHTQPNTTADALIQGNTGAPV